MIQPVLRFAPSPNGALHLGHALSALVGHDMARRLGGRFLVRVEDIDTTRCRPELIAPMLDDLAWLGIAFERPVLRQSEHFPVYRAAALRLEARGLLYPCFATRAEIAAATTGAIDPDGAPLYPGLHKHLDGVEVRRRRAAGEPFALRLHMDRALAEVRRIAAGPLTFTSLDEALAPAIVEAHPGRWGDVVIVRKDTPASYHLAVVVDDARQGVTHVTRGQDLLAATDVHRLLQVLLGLPAPLYHHHRLMTDGDGRKLAKSARDQSLADFRRAGATAAEIRRMVGLGSTVA